MYLTTKLCKNSNKLNDHVKNTHTHYADMKSKNNLQLHIFDFSLTFGVLPSRVTHRLCHFEIVPDILNSISSVL